MSKRDVGYTLIPIVQYCHKNHKQKQLQSAISTIFNYLEKLQHQMEA